MDNIDSRDKCTCDVPCKRKSYDVSLSHAQLSKYNIDRLVMNNETKRSNIREKFHTAMEASRRVNQGIFYFGPPLVYINMTCFVILLNLSSV